MGINVTSRKCIADFLTNNHKPRYTSKPLEGACMRFFERSRSMSHPKEPQSNRLRPLRTQPTNSCAQTTSLVAQLIYLTVSVLVLSTPTEVTSLPTSP